MSRHSNIGFFDRDTTVEFIRTFGDASDFTIVVGAGASIDRGSPSWDRLVQLLLLGFLEDRPELVAQEIVGGLTDLFDPASLGSIVTQLFDQAYPPTTARHLLHNQIFQHLYDRWAPRESLSTSVGLLAVTLESLGKRVHIITTNYDDNIELSTERLGQDEDYPIADIAESRDILFKRYTAPPPLRHARGKIPVVHMNGLISHSNDHEGAIVFSESDFEHVASTNTGWTLLIEYLAKRFESHITAKRTAASLYICRTRTVVRRVSRELHAEKVRSRGSACSCRRIWSDSRMWRLK